MKKYLSYIITLCLIVIVILMLIRNRKDMNVQIAFSEQKVTNFPVSVHVAQKEPLNTSLEVSGILAPAQELMLMAETQGRVLTIFKKEGQWVNRGEAIAQVDNELMQAELSVTQMNLEKARKDRERADVLSEGGAITQQQHEGLQLNEQAAESRYTVSEKRMEDALIKAPISGYINKLFIKEGGMIGGAVPVCELVNIQSFKMSVKADERDIIKIIPGQEVNIQLASMQEIALKGTVTSVSAKADYALQYGVEIIIPENPGGQLKAGMVAGAVFLFPDKEPGLVIPKSAIIGSMQSPQVYVINGNKAILKSITVSISNGEKVKVDDGLLEGDKVVLAGKLHLYDGADVHIVE
jgi:membrane fusion protein, multidrug efflux system